MLVSTAGDRLLPADGDRLGLAGLGVGDSALAGCIEGFALLVASKPGEGAGALRLAKGSRLWRPDLIASIVGATKPLDAWPSPEGRNLFGYEGLVLKLPEEAKTSRV